MSYLYVKWNSSGCCSPADVCAIRACLGFVGHSRNGGLRRRRRCVWAAVEGAANEETCLDKNRMTCHSILIEVST
jgi:hypothetical protein